LIPLWWRAHRLSDCVLLLICWEENSNKDYPAAIGRGSRDYKQEDSIKIHAHCTWKNMKRLIDIRLDYKVQQPSRRESQFRRRFLDATSMQSRGSNLTFLSFFKKKECTMQTLVATQKGASTFSRSRSTVAPSKFTCRPRLTRMQRGQLDGFNTKLVTFRFLRCQPRGRKYTASAFSNWAYLKSLQ